MKVEKNSQGSIVLDLNPSSKFTSSPFHHFTTSPLLQFTSSPSLIVIIAYKPLALPQPPPPPPPPPPTTILIQRLTSTITSTITTIIISKLRRLTELNNRLREDLERERIPVSQAAKSIIQYTSQTKDFMVPSIWGTVDKKDDPYAPQQSGGCCLVM
ncbi:hypothetical protein EYC84_007427 [Monilinia fructicola]|uniref:Guanine nucleotide-binding protein subunit gamma n=1 Tax=Monilinia fructicola TaxID=38448 RepID=A0A5M9JJ66_MONFR|nr:hypothetical protein EYC84_007427 [Monilinia fructicola]